MRGALNVAFGFRLVEGPWGGGNRFLQNLREALLAAGHQVHHDLRARDLDIILLLDPRSRHPSATFTAGAILRYLAFRNPGALVVHRVNECDERKNTRTMNPRLRLANYCADHTVFVGGWLRELPVWTDHPPRAASVIRNGADPAVFNPVGFRAWDGREPLRLVTHHWGGNWMKGFDVYSRIDGMLGDPEWRERLSFTYIGNLPSGFRFANARYVEPLDGSALADELRAHHGYVTASLHEPGGNHQNEGALCGLPLLYRNSGCLPEYCDGFGVAFDGPDDFPEVLESYMHRYDELVPLMSGYPNTAGNCVAEWIGLFEDLVPRREAIVSARRLWRDPLAFALNQFPF